MISPEVRLMLLHYISKIVIFQLAVVGVMSVLTVCLLVYRRWLEKKQNYFEQLYAGLLVEEMLQSMEQKPADVIRPVSSFRWIRLQTLKKSLLNQIQSVSGAEKYYLVKRYFDLGLAEHDIRLCDSFLWWKRLEGLARLKSLASDKLAELFFKMKFDTNELLSATAKAALSELNHPLNRVRLQELAPLLENGRQSHIFEIASNWCKIHGFEKIFHLVNEHGDVAIRNSMFSAILNIKTPESATLFTDFLEEAHYENAELLSNIIRALREVGDPESLSTIISYVYHPDERVQQRAIEYLLEFLPEDRKGELIVLEKDPSPAVQRILQDWYVRKAAA